MEPKPLTSEDLTRLPSTVYVIAEPPPVAGVWRLGPPASCIRFSIGKRPRWLTRVLMRWLLEWEWIDTPPRGRHSGGEGQ